MRRSELSYRSLFENMLEGYAYCRVLLGDGDRPQDFECISVNRVFEELTGLKEVIGRKVSEVIPGVRESNPELFEICARVALSGKPERFEIYLPLLEKWFFVSVYSTEKGYFVALFDNITERKLAEAEKSRLAAIVESSDDAVIGKTLDGEITTWNRGAENIYGYAAEEVVGRKISVLAPNDLSDEAPAILKRISCGEYVEHYDTLRRRKDGRIIQVSLTVSAIRDASGKIIGASTIARDITERKQMEEELRNSRDELELRVNERTAELERSNQALQEFASIASHDMKEPLRKVISFGCLLREKHKDSLGDSGYDYLNRMIDAAQRMQSLLTSLLEYARVTMNPDPFKEVDLCDIIHEVLSDLEIRIKMCGGQVQIGELAAIQADPTQMHQLFQNLIANSLKFHKESEKPFVSVKSAVMNDGIVEISVEDNGIGFDETFADRIFAPFHRLCGRSEFEGTGMGLAICKKIVERHKGSITAKSAPGAGATFIIRLPATLRGGRLIL